MKLSVTVVVILFGFLGCTKAEQTKDYGTAFTRSFQNLHRGPPDEMVMSRKAKVETKWITQKMDNFDKQNTRTWPMRYMVNEEYFKPGGPIFIFLGGEWEIAPSRITNGIYSDLAQEHNGILFYTEHRYYGKSLPTPDFSVENLQYLHVNQSLADVAHFIRTIRKIDTRLANSKVIIAGCSYSATMAVWFSKQYPDLLNGAWASSGPLYAKVNFPEYFDVVAKALLELGSEQCYWRIRNGIAELESMFVNKRAAEAKAMLQLCNSFDHENDLDMWSLFSTISNQFAGLVQYQKGNDVPAFCHKLMQYEDDVTAISSLLVDNSGCLDVRYENTLKYYLDTSTTSRALRPWIYQTCNEFGWYQTSDSKVKHFGKSFPLTLYTTLCYDVFGPKFTNEHIFLQVLGTNIAFGALNPGVKNVYFTHGGLDPWGAVGHNEAQGASVIASASHCTDFGSIDKDRDSPEMYASKQRLINLVRDWLA